MFGITLSTLLACFFAFSAKAQAQHEPSIAAIAIENSDTFSTLVTALTVAGLADDFDACIRSYWRHGCSQFTVFAPTNAAFAAVDAGLLGKLTTNDEFKTHLAQLLKYHVIRGAVLSTDVRNDQNLHTLQGDDITTRTHPIRINDSNVIAPFDVRAFNGVVHTIDSVLLPSFITNTIPMVAENAGIFKTLLAAAGAAGVADFLGTADVLTVFAPTDDAFAKLGTATIDALLADPNRLANILKYHVVVDAVVFENELSEGSVEMANGDSIHLNKTSKSRYGKYIGYWFGWVEKTFTINEKVKFVDTDILAQNGVIHVIDTVLLPPSEM